MEANHTVGRRKTAIARIYLTPGSGKILINDRDYKDYFPTLPLQYKVNQAFELVNQKDQYDVKANVEGGGITGQAEAVRLAIARALVKINEEHKPVLRTNGLLTRDSRMVERKKPGQKKARKRFQFSKR
jgi:small subunit ribosomal protein S9